MIAAALLLAGCASATGSRWLSTSVTEVMSMGQNVGAVGTHFIRVRIHNVSADPVVIQSINVEASGPDLVSDHDPGTFDQTIMPDETVPFDLEVTVTSRNRQAVGGQLESVIVTIGYAVGQHDMIDTGTYSLSRERSGG